ncbi:DNA polymerase III subunit alpha [Oceanivirga miroungae]|uniref:DNA-directed DNA polymerase n=1 Tax=Oceanivirga miroungae TaxID=1130046 RepID=A0A6I8M588_9FUSO|nr:DNA polymerase III subunit alpha [Oceanivirga miroungae]VWL85088.1 DNA polymerase III subunit alpha [Oceanivirga miroungae]
MYINLKLHSDYDLLVAASKIEDYLEKAKKINMPCISVSNTNLFNAINNYILSKSYGIRYIFSLEVDGFNLYAKNIKGYKKLIYLASLDKASYSNLQKNCENLVVITGSFNSYIYEKLKNNEFDKAYDLVLEYKENFSDFYIEIPTFIAKTNLIDSYIQLIKATNVNYVITSDTYYLEKEDEYLQDVILSIKENKTVSRLKKTYPSNLYFKTYEELKDEFIELEDEIFSKGVKNTFEIAKKCDVEINFNELKLPKYEKNIDEKEELKIRVLNALEKINKSDDSEYINRLDYELEVIDKMKFNSYFLITQDIVNYARQNDILVGVGRGSAAGSLVSYLLNITKVDPIKYKLIFERFLNEKRQGMPDIDIDIEAKKRDLLINYVVSKYGIEYVSNIISFSKLKEKQIEKDLKRVLDRNANFTKIISKLLNNVRHTSIHASGLIISQDKLVEDVPVIYDKNTNTNVSQYDMKELEKLGLLKMDFLALANLDIVADTLKEINLSLDDIRLDDSNTFSMYNSGDTVGIFQVEAYGMTELIKKMKINSVEDISLALALYRPGPLASGMVDKLLQRKNNNEKIEYDIDDLKDILDESFGVIIYQEQVMKIATKIAGFSLVEADILRKAISKKKADLIEKLKDNFISGAIKNGYEKEKVKKLYELIENFAEYGFNKAHSISYAITSYYTAYLKTNFKKEYMTSLLNHKITDFSKLNVYYNELLKYNIDLFGVDINKSDIYFKVENEGIRYGIYSISGISKNFSNDIVKERELRGNFLNINDFAVRMIKYGLNEKNLKILAESGAFLEFNMTRAEISENAQEIIEIATKKNDDEKNITRKLFYTGEVEEKIYLKKDIKEYTKEKINLLEFKNLGIALKNTSSFEYKMIYSIFSNIDNYYLAFVSSKDKLFINGLEYEVRNINLSMYINKICVAKLDKNKIVSIYTLKDSLFSKNTRVYISIDELSDDIKVKLKDLIRNNGGSNRVFFYQNKKKLESNTYVDLNLDTLTSLVNKVGIKNIRIKL